MSNKHGNVHTPCQSTLRVSGTLCGVDSEPGTYAGENELAGKAVSDNSIIRE